MTLFNDPITNYYVLCISAKVSTLPVNFSVNAQPLSSAAATTLLIAYTRKRILSFTWPLQNVIQPHMIITFKMKF